VRLHASAHRGDHQHDEAESLVVHDKLSFVVVVVSLQVESLVLDVRR
jgi:hypothetical protein